MSLHFRKPLETSIQQAMIIEEGPLRATVLVTILCLCTYDLSVNKLWKIFQQNRDSDKDDLI